MGILGPPTGELVPQGTTTDPKILKRAQQIMSGPTGLASTDSQGYANQYNTVLAGLKKAAGQ